MGRGKFRHRRAARLELIQHATTDRMGDRRIYGVKLAGRIFNRKMPWSSPWWEIGRSVVRTAS
jgi:hypothetical protein